MSEDGLAKRNMIHRHNAMKGHAAMMIAQCKGIVASQTATAEAKATAHHIWGLAMLLRTQLEERQD